MYDPDLTGNNMLVHDCYLLDTGIDEYALLELFRVLCRMFAQAHENNCRYHDFKLSHLEAPYSDMLPVRRLSVRFAEDSDKLQSEEMLVGLHQMRVRIKEKQEKQDKIAECIKAEARRWKKAYLGAQFCADKLPDMRSERDALLKERDDLEQICEEYYQRERSRAVDKNFLKQLHTVISDHLKSIEEKEKV